MKTRRQFSKFFDGGLGARGHVMIHDREDMPEPQFTIGFTADGHSSTTHLTIEGLRALVDAGLNALAALNSDPLTESKDSTEASAEVA